MPSLFLAPCCWSFLIVVVVIAFFFFGRKKYKRMTWLFYPIQEDQKMATRLASTMFNSFKGRPTQVAYYLYSSCGFWALVLHIWYNECFLQGRIYQGKEPPQFVALFQPMVVLKVSYLACTKIHLVNQDLIIIM